MRKKILSIFLVILLIAMVIPFASNVKGQDNNEWIKVVKWNNISYRRISTRSLNLLENNMFTIAERGFTKYGKSIGIFTNFGIDGSVSNTYALNTSYGVGFNYSALLNNRDIIEVGDIARNKSITNIDIAISIFSTSGKLEKFEIIGSKYNDFPNTAHTTPDGGCIIAGVCAYKLQNRYNAFALKLDGNGNKQWMTVIGSSLDEWFNDIIPTSDGGFLAVGRSGYGKASDPDNYRQNVLIVKFDSKGQVVWTKTYHLTNVDIGVRAVEDKDGYIVAGSSRDMNSFIMKVRKDNGEIVWSKVFGDFNKSNNNDSPYTEIRKIKDGLFAVGGWDYDTNPGFADAYIVLFDSNGKIRLMRDVSSKDDEFFSGLVVKNETLLLSGVTNFNSDFENEQLLVSMKINGSMIATARGGYKVSDVKFTEKDVQFVPVNRKYGSRSVDSKMVDYKKYVTVEPVSTKDIPVDTVWESSNVYLPNAPKITKANVSSDSVTIYFTPSTQGTYPIAGYAIYRGTEPGKEDFSKPIATVEADKTEYTDKNVEIGKTYYYVVKAFDNQNPPNYSKPSNEIKVEIEDTTPPVITITSPEDNYTTDADTITITGTATDKGTGIDTLTINGNNISVSKDGSFSYTVNLTEGTNTINIVATDKAGNKITKTMTITYTSPVKTTVITLQPNNPYMTVNGVQQEIDPGRGTKPVIIPKWGRTVVPIRAIVEALGGTISWDPVQRMVTINLGDNTINLWIGKPQAEVNGVMKWIDESNHNVKPIIVNGRTMLPLRFVAESLGCSVDWDPATKTITITYTSSQ